VIVRLGERGVGCVLLDIEGTTTPISFVHDVLFSFARAHLDEFLSSERDSAGVRDVVYRLITEHAEDVARGESPPSREGEEEVWVAAYVRWLMDRDRKSPGLKLLQGQIWERGYRAGELRGQVYPDVPAAVRRWYAGGMTIAIYSSGSELAQRRLFESTEHGDLTPFISAFFDTAVGAKTSAASYASIARGLSRPAAEVLFVSDVTAELSAARQAGMQVLLSVRPGNAVQPGAAEFETIRTFDEIEV
jgi:enolase-phosphatase E1